jgi:hypothetical protein
MRPFLSLTHSPMLHHGCWQTSPTTYSIVGTSNKALVALIGITLMNDPVTAKGVCVCVCARSRAVLSCAGADCACTVPLVQHCIQLESVDTQLLLLLLLLLLRVVRLLRVVAAAVAADTSLALVGLAFITLSLTGSTIYALSGQSAPPPPPQQQQHRQQQQQSDGGTGNVGGSGGEGEGDDDGDDDDGEHAPALPGSRTTGVGGVRVV